jgi:hypothetical protein
MTIYVAAARLNEASTAKNAADAEAALTAYAGMAHRHLGASLWVTVTVSADSLSDAASTALRAIEELTGMTALSIEASTEAEDLHTA